jgi:hypothetical protein
LRNEIRKTLIFTDLAASGRILGMSPWKRQAGGPGPYHPPQCLPGEMWGEM